MEDVKPRKLGLYAQDQLAGIGRDGEIFVITFIDNRIFHHREPAAAHMALHGRDIYIATSEGDLLGLSFERKERLVYSSTGSPIRAVAPCGNRGIVTGHADGELRLWLFEQGETLSLPGRGGEITSVAVDYQGLVYAVNRNALLRIWDPESEQIRTAKIDGPAPQKILFRPPHGIVILSPPGTIRLLNQDTLECRRCDPAGQHSISGLALHPDGRLFFGVNQGRTGNGEKGGQAAVFAPEQESPGLHLLDAYSLRLDDLLLMGPRIVTCGADADGRFSIRILGTRYFVRTEAAHRELQPE
jgi:WD40 repeat protein